MSTTPSGRPPTAADAPFGAPFGSAPSGNAPSAPGPFEAAALAGAPSRDDAAGGASPTTVLGVPAQYAPGRDEASPAAATTALLRTRGPLPGAAAPAGTVVTAVRSARRRPSPVVVVALAGGAVLAGALGAWAVMPTGADTAGAGSTVVTAGTTATAGPGGTPATPSAAPGAAPSASPAVDPASGARDPFAPLVVVPGGAGGAGPSAPGVPTSAATGLPGAGDAGLGVSGTTGSLGSGAGTSGGSTVSTGSTGIAAPVPRTTVTVTAAPAPPAAPLTTAQTCSAVAGPLDSVEQLLTSSTSGGTGAVDTGTALRTPVAALRAAVSATADAALASRLDVATSSAEALRSQLLGGVAVTSDQLTTQSSLDAAVRTACA